MTALGLVPCWAGDADCSAQAAGSMQCWEWPLGCALAPDTHYGGTVCAFSVAQSCLALATPWIVTVKATLSVGFPGKNTGMGRQFLL